MENIDLSLESKSEPYSGVFDFESIVGLRNLIVIVGSPGSGKTSMLEKYYTNNKHKVILKKVKDFAKDEVLEIQSCEMLLLDGFDEYSCTQNDKTSAAPDLAKQIKNMPEGINIVISCREMDWYGSDETSLNSLLNRDAFVYRILPLNYSQQIELADLLGVSNPKEFVKKYANYGFLDNPQMFMMISDLYINKSEDNPRTKQALFEYFIMGARERNETYSRNFIHKLESGEMLKHVGYIAFYYIFSGANEITDGFIDSISYSERGYSYLDLIAVSKSTLFQNNDFIHRSIAEYAAGKFIYDVLMSNSESIGISRIKGLFVINKKIPTELRGAYAWLVSLSEDDQLIDVDPCYQSVYGDNSLFSLELKKKIINFGSDYALTNPYFLRMSLKPSIDDFYCEELDEILEKEFNGSKQRDDHFIHYILSIYLSSDLLSARSSSFLKAQLRNTEFVNGDTIKTGILDYFSSDSEFLLSVLIEIKDGKILDSTDRIKDFILDKLYLQTIKHNEIYQYLDIYKEKIQGDEFSHINYFRYLNRTPYETKYEVLDALCLRYREKSSDKINYLPGYVKDFLSEYLLETLLLFDDKLSTRDIYQILKHFNGYIDCYESLKIESYNYDYIERVELGQSKLQILTNELYILYIDEKLSDEADKYPLGFNYFFSYKSHSVTSNAYLDLMKVDRDISANRRLFGMALDALPKDDSDNYIVTSKIHSVCEIYDFKGILNHWENPPEPEWSIREKNYSVECENKARKTIEENEEYFKKLSDHEIQTSFNALFFAAELNNIHESEQSQQKQCVTNKLFLRLKKIIKTSIFHDSLDVNLTTIKSLSERSPSARFNIDIIYYVSANLISKDEIKGLHNKEFLKYLYINTLLKNSGRNIIMSDFLVWVKDDDTSFVINSLKEYISYLFEFHGVEYKDIAIAYIAKIEDITFLEKIVRLQNVSTATGVTAGLLKMFLTEFASDIDIEDLNTISRLELNESNQDLLSAIIAFKGNNKSFFRVDNSVLLYDLFIPYGGARFSSITNKISSHDKVKIIDIFMSVYNTEELIKSFNGIQSDQDNCASFLKRQALDELSLGELLALKKLRSNISDVWTVRLSHEINDREQIKVDKSHRRHDIESLKKFIFSQEVISHEDFFNDLIIKIESVVKEIEDNRNNEKEPFYNKEITKHSKGAKSTKRTQKTENECRDMVANKLHDKYSRSINISNEHPEGHNRVDFNVKCKKHPFYEVQIECKRDDNGGLLKGIGDQLIGKYFSSKVEFGVYLIFYFGTKKDKQKKLDQVSATIPFEYEDKIKIICLDLTPKGEK